MHQTRNEDARDLAHSPTRPTRRADPAHDRRPTGTYSFHQAGEKAGRRFQEFFAVTIRNKNTRQAYYRAVCKFCHWCDARGIYDLRQVEPMMVAAFIEEETQLRHQQTVKQELAAIKGLFDYLVIGQVMPFNPASSVRGPAYSTNQGKTPVLASAEVRALLDSIPTETKDGTPYSGGFA